MEDKQKQTTSRNAYLKSLQQFIDSSVETIHKSLNRFYWTKDKTTLQVGEKVLSICPLDSAHRVPTDNLQMHTTICHQKLHGYTEDSIFLSSAPEHSKGSIVLDKNLQADIILKAAAENSLIKLDKNLQADIILKAAAENSLIKLGENVWDRDVPQTSDRVFSDFTTDERRVLYDYVVSKTADAVPQLSEYSLPFWAEDKAEPMTKEQLLTAQRDAKRRRVRYRVAKVHTKSKNYSEVLREVINNQMMAYEDWLRDKNGDTETLEAVPEKPCTEEVKDKKTEMVWLESDFRTNPHVRWRYMLKDKEKNKVGNKYVSEKVGRKERSLRTESWDRYDNRCKRDEKRSNESRNNDSNSKEYRSTRHKEERDMCYDENNRFKRQKTDYEQELRNEDRFRESKSSGRSRSKHTSHNKDIALIKSEEEYNHQSRSLAKTTDTSSECVDMNSRHASKKDEIESNHSKSSYAKKSRKKPKKKNKHKHNKKKHRIDKCYSSTTDTD